jgi:hypothetical protein
MPAESPAAGQVSGFLTGAGAWGRRLPLSSLPFPGLLPYQALGTELAMCALGETGCRGFVLRVKVAVAKAAVETHAPRRHRFVGMGGAIILFRCRFHQRV